ncbi:hypothetical protein K445DRAFT_168344 [Daldinia sp. EC12]|nr:hypothetical protein K445DRAFT_168344 [Daldinia sp. EC12]
MLHEMQANKANPTERAGDSNFRGLKRLKYALFSLLSLLEHTHTLICYKKDHIFRRHIQFRC